MPFKKKEKLSASVLTAQELIGVDEINDNLLYTKSKYIFAYISVRSMSDSLYSNEEKQAACEKLVRSLEKEKNAWQLLSVPRVINTQEMINNLITLKRQTGSNARLALLDGEIDAVQAMARAGAKEPMIILKLWEKEDRNGERDLEKRIADMISSLKERQGLSVQRLENADIAFLCKQFADLGAPQEPDEDMGELPVMTGQNTYPTQTNLINDISPVAGITVSNRKIVIGDTTARVYGAMKYPREIKSYGWLTDIMNNTEAITCITFNPANPGELADALSRSIKKEAGEALGSRGVRESKAHARKAADADRMLDEMEDNHEVMGLASILVMPFSPEEEKFEDVCKRTLSLFSDHRIKLKILGQLQKEGFQSLSPYGVSPIWVEQAFSRIMPLYTLCGGSPMCINSYQDKGGFYFAKTSTGNLVVTDMWYRGRDRTNSNFFVLGKAGMGKSTLIKHIIQTEFMRGTKILIIDPESEYREITRLLGGSVFYAGGGKAKINILQVRPSPVDDEEEAPDDKLYQGKGNDLAMHLKNLDTFFRAYLVDSPEILYSFLEQSSLDLYKRFGMDWDTNFHGIAPERFPVMADLYKLLSEQGREHSECKELAARISSAAIGSDNFIFNGHTNIDLDTPILCFDTNSLQNASDKIKRANYLNILGLNWEIMSRNKDERALLICDEGYLLVDPNLPQALMFLRNIEKRCRKFNGALGFATHSVVDLLHPSIRQYGQAILDISTYKFFLAADGQNLKEIAALYDLTEKQQSILRAGERGQSLGMLGSTMLHLNFELPQYKLDNMGTAGGN